MKKILIPIDFSTCAEAAFNAGLELAEKFNSEIHLLHIITAPYDWVKVPKEREKNYPDIQKKIGAARAKLEAMVRTAKKKNIKAQEFIIFNKSFDGIMRHAQDFGNDFLIMGTFGSAGIKKIMGSNTKHVIQNTIIPALIVKENFKLGSLKKLTFAHDFNMQEMAPFKMVKEFSLKLDLPIDLLEVNTPNHFEDTRVSLKNMKESAERHKIEDANFNIYNSFTVEEGIMRFNNTSKNLILVVYHQRKGIAKLFNPSITEYLVNKSSSGILAFPSLY